jgi:hypothetical protein
MTEHKTEDGQCQGRAEAFSSEASKAERLLAVASSEQPSLYPCDTPESLKWQRGNSSVSLVLQRGTTPCSGVTGFGVYSVSWDAAGCTYAESPSGLFWNAAGRRYCCPSCGAFHWPPPKEMIR